MTVTFEEETEAAIDDPTTVTMNSIRDEAAAAAASTNRTTIAMAGTGETVATVATTRPTATGTTGTTGTVTEAGTGKTVSVVTATRITIDAEMGHHRHLAGQLTIAEAAITTTIHEPTTTTTGK
jgi:hypothetical protein